MDKSNKPKQYTQGYCEFYKLKFYLTPDVLIPRPETELLVDEVIGFAKLITHNSSRITILDIGTGSGCIAISLAKNLPNAKIIALDISEKALKVAEKNATFHKVESKILFLNSDLLSFVTSNNRLKTPDIIVANLPYIPTSKLMLIDPMVRDFEPKIALDGGRDGFELYRKLFTQMKEKNFFPKYLVAEIDEDQGELALQEAKIYFPDANVEIKKDLAKKDRILIIRF